MIKSVGIYGAGAWGKTINFITSHNTQTFISSRSTKDIKNFVSISKILEQEYIILVIGAQYIKDFFKQNKINQNTKFLIASKGIDVKENKFLHQICTEFVNKNNIAFLSGPSFAKEVMQKLPTTLSISSTNKNLAKTFSTIFGVDFIKTYISDDVIGSEIAGAYKNSIAIASGICCGLELGNNAQASLISRGLVEMNRFGIFFGAKSDTFLNITGAGDLFLTASSTMSRNFRLGLLLAKGKMLDESLKEIKEVVEGVGSTYAICSIANKYDIYTPIASELNNVLLGGNVRESVTKLLEN